MIDKEEFRKSAHQIVDWMADYFEKIEDYPVKSKVAPGEIYENLPDSAPVQSEPISDIMKDFQEIIMPGITH
jgi:aromatic-L-amino-acid decarboxylase